MNSTNIQIAIKIRPFIAREKSEKLEPQWLVKENNIVQIDSTQNFIGEPYGFDHIFDETKSNKDVYDDLVKPLVLSCLEGINSTIFVYGQTSSGKTHTMLGDKNIPGIISFTIEDIFTYIRENTTKHFLLRCSYLEIYNERINDLLDTKAKDIKIREDYNKGVYVVVKEEVIREPEELFNLMKKGMKTRKIGCTDMNERSSRSHTIFKLVIESQSKESQGSITESTLSLVDLAGSERVGQMNRGRERQVEGVFVNKSLTTLGLVIRKLSENESYINYRDSKLTRLLQHSLGGNSSTLIIATITVAASEETKSTLEFAQRAKHVKNRPIINERATDKDQLKQYEHLCEDYKDQIEKLRQERIERDKTINTLEDKISNIKLFTAGNFENPLKPPRMPHRRHTLGHYKPHKKKVSIMESAGVEENSDGEDLAKIANVDDKENSFLNDSVASTPYKLAVTKKANTSKSPSPNSRLEKELLEESYVNLKYFTSLEKQFQGKSDELEELRELIDRLREENFQLREENLNRGGTYIKMMEENKYIYEQLVVLRNVLVANPAEEIRRNSLHTILEEDVELFIDAIESTICSSEINMNENTISEENQHLKNQLNNKDRIIEELKNDMNAKILCKEVECVKLYEENEQLKGQIKSKDETIDKLKANIIYDKDVKEAELEILNNRIKKLNDYKEEMHTKMSELQKLQEAVLDGEEVSTLKSQNKALKEGLDNLRKEHHELKQLTEYGTIKIAELKDQIKSLMKSESKKDNILLEKDLELNILKKANEDARKQNKQLKAELEDTVFLLSGEQKELERFNQELEKKVEDIEALERTVTNFKKSQQEQIKIVQELTDNNFNLREDIVTMEEQIKILDEIMGENLKLKDKLQLNMDMKQKVEEKDEQLAFLKETCETLQQELRNSREQMERTSLELEEKTDLYNVMLINYSEKTIVIESLEKEMQELNDQLNTFSALPAIDDLKDQLEQRLDEIKHLEEDKKELMQNLDNNVALEATIKGYLKDIQILQATSNKQKTENEELNNQLHEKIKELDEKTGRYQDAISKYNNRTVEYECLAKSNLELKRELDILSEMQKNEKVEGELVLNRLKKENDDLISQLNNLNTKINEAGLFKEKYERLKCELQDVLFQLNGEQKELENVCQKLEEKTRNIDALKQVISSLKNNREQQIDKIQELTNNNLSLQENIYRKEEQIKMLQEVAKQSFDDNIKEVAVLKETYELSLHELETTKEQLKCTTFDLQEKTELYNSVLSDNSKKKTVIESLEKEIGELKNKIDHLHLQIKQLLKEIENLREVNKNMIQILDSNKCLHQDIQSLQVTSDEQRAEIEALKTQLRLKTIENFEDIKSQLMQSLNDNGSLKQTIHNYLKDIQILQVTSEDQKSEISDLRKQLHSKIAELDLKTNSYHDLLINYESQMKEKNLLRDQLHANIIELNEKAESYDNLVASYNAKALENEQHSKEITKLKIELKEKIESYNVVLSTCNIKVKEIENLEKEKTYLEQAVHKYLGDIQILQATSDAQNREIHELTDKLDSKLSELSEMTKGYNNVLSKYNAKMVDYECLTNENAQLKSLAEAQQNNQSETQENDELNRKLSSVSEALRLKTEEIDKLSKERNGLLVSRQEIESLLLDTKRQLKERCEDYFDLKGKYNALEIQVFNCKKNLTLTKQELEKEKNKLNNLQSVLQNSDVNCKHLPLVEQVTEIVAKIKGLNQKLEEAQQQLKSKTLQIAAANEEIKTKVIDLEKHRFDYQKCKLQFEELHRMHVDTEKRYGILESKFKAEKSKVESFSHKLQISQCEVASLQAKLNDLLQHKKSVQEKENQSDKNPVSRLSDEGRPLSPNDLRRIKRQSIHDQRRGLASDIGNVFEDKDLGCSDCMDLKNQLSKIQDENKTLLGEIDDLKADNKFLDKENEDMLKIIKEMEKKENDLYDQLDKCKSSKDVRPTDFELNKIRTELNEIRTTNIELQNELEHNKKVIGEYKDRIAQLESAHLKVEYGKVLADNICHKVDKGTQAMCDLHQKYSNLKKIVLLRRREGNYLRSKLNLPPDCPVLPEDVQRMQIPDQLNDHVP